MLPFLTTPIRTFATSWRNGLAWPKMAQNIPMTRVPACAKRVGLRAPDLPRAAGMAHCPLQNTLILHAVPWFKFLGVPLGLMPCQLHYREEPLLPPLLLHALCACARTPTRARRRRGRSSRSSCYHTLISVSFSLVWPRRSTIDCWRVSEVEMVTERARARCYRCLVANPPLESRVRSAPYT